MCQQLALKLILTISFTTAVVVIVVGVCSHHLLYLEQFPKRCIYTVVNSMFNMVEVLGVDGPLRLFVEFMERREGLRAELHK